MKKTLHILVAVIATQLLITPLQAGNYYCDFEGLDDAAQWKTWAGKNIVRETWAIGTSLRCTGRFGMYTSDYTIDTLGVNTQAWAKTGGYCVSAYHKLNLQNGTYTISLDALSPSDVVSVALIHSDTLTNAQIKTSTGTTYSTAIGNNNIPGLTDLKALTWTHYSADYRVTEATEEDDTYILVITFRSQGASSLIGAAVDNIEVSRKQTDATACDYAIKDLSLSLISGYAQLTWRGNAGAYEVRYFNGDTLLVQMDTVYATPNGGIDTCLVPISTIANGVYSFMVRTADCESNSAWAYVRNKLIYDPTSHCIDYLNFDARGVQCSYGSGSWSGSSESLSPATMGYNDYGSQSRYSTHTLHFVPNETDIMTNGELRTVPQGSFASVRLGGKEPNNQYPGQHYERVKYTIHVDSTMGVVLFRYAYVGQTGGHGSGDLTQPHLRLKLTDPNGNIINGAECGSFLFMAPNNDADMAALNSNPRTAGWHKGAQDDGQGSVCSDYVYWRDWTTIGVNVQDYLDQDIFIEITNYGCGASCHYGYAYFVLDCASGKLGGVTCGEKPREMVADEGFAYRWYKPFNMQEPFYEGQDPAAQSLFVSPNDSNTYYVDLMSKSNTNCYFTLHASAMARLPKALFSAKHAPKDCRNYLAVTNESGLFGFFTNAQTGRQDSARIEGGLNHQIWHIRTKSGLTDMVVDTSYVAPILASNDGDSVYIDLYVSMEEGCESSNHMAFAVPAIGPNTSVDSLILCQGQVIEFEGQTYTEAGDFPLMTEQNIYGCDSTRTLHIDYQFSYIFQRWGNVLSVYKSRNPMDESEPLYDFIGFQWYHNGEPIEGATQSYYYAGEGVDFPYGDTYSVELIHPDSTLEMSCDFVVGVTALEEVELNKVQGDKFIHNGTMYIRANGVLYDARGRRVRNLIKD